MKVRLILRILSNLRCGNICDMVFVIAVYYIFIFIGDSSNTPKSSSELQEALIKPEESKIQRKVSFRETPNISNFLHCAECEAEARYVSNEKLIVTIFGHKHHLYQKFSQNLIISTKNLNSLRCLFNFALHCFKNY